MNTPVMHKEIIMNLRRLSDLLSHPLPYQVTDAAENAGITLLPETEQKELGLSDVYAIDVSFYDVPTRRRGSSPFRTRHYLVCYTKDLPKDVLRVVTTKNTQTTEQRCFLMEYGYQFNQNDGIISPSRKQILFLDDLEKYFTSIPEDLRIRPEFLCRILFNRLADTSFVKKQYYKIMRQHFDFLLQGSGLSLEDIVGQPLIDGTLTLDIRVPWSAEQRAEAKERIRRLIPMTTLIQEHLEPLAKNILTGQVLPENCLKYQLHTSLQQLSRLANVLGSMKAYFLGYDNRLLLGYPGTEIYEWFPSTISTLLQQLPTMLLDIWSSLEPIMISNMQINIQDPPANLTWCRKAYGFVIEAPLPLHD